MIFPTLDESSKVWVYQSDRFLDEHDCSVIKEKLNEFMQEWASHGNQLYGDFAIVENRFVILAADETKAGVSGCSIDTSVRKIKEIGGILKIDFFNRLNIFIEKEDEFKYVHFSDLNKYSDWNLFNSIEDLAGLRSNWKTQISASPYA